MWVSEGQYFSITTLQVKHTFKHAHIFTNLYLNEE